MIKAEESLGIDCFHGVVSKMGQVALPEPTPPEAVSKASLLCLWLET